MIHKYKKGVLREGITWQFLIGDEDRHGKDAAGRLIEIATKIIYFFLLLGIVKFICLLLFF